MTKFRNICKCKICGDVIESKTVHDFKECSCGACFTDGGTEYVRRGWNPKFGTVDDVIEHIVCEVDKAITINGIEYQKKGMMFYGK